MHNSWDVLDSTAASEPKNPGNAPIDDAWDDPNTWVSTQRGGFGRYPCLWFTDRLVKYTSLRVLTHAAQVHIRQKSHVWLGNNYSSTSMSRSRFVQDRTIVFMYSNYCLQTCCQVLWFFYWWLKRISKNNWQVTWHLNRRLATIWKTRDPIIMSC